MLKLLNTTWGVRGCYNNIWKKSGAVLIWGFASPWDWELDDIV